MKTQNSQERLAVFTEKLNAAIKKGDLTLVGACNAEGCGRLRRG